MASATLSQAPLGEMHTKCRLTQSTYFQMYSHTQTQSLNFETLIYSAFESESQHHLKIRRTFLLCFLLKRLTECKPKTHQMICSLRIVFKITQGGSSQLFLTGKEGKDKELNAAGGKNGHKSRLKLEMSANANWSVQGNGSSFPIKTMTRNNHLLFFTNHLDHHRHHRVLV